jgi:hypothetical protein
MVDVSPGFTSSSTSSLTDVSAMSITTCGGFGS